MKTLFHTVLIALVLSGCAGHVEIDHPDGNGRTSTAPVGKVRVLPIGKPAGPYAPGSIVRWDNGDRTHGALLVHPGQPAGARGLEP